MPYKHLHMFVALWLNSFTTKKKARLRIGRHTETCQCYTDDKKIPEAKRNQVEYKVLQTHILHLFEIKRTTVSHQERMKHWSNMTEHNRNKNLCKEKALIY